MGLSKYGVSDLRLDSSNTEIETNSTLQSLDGHMMEIQFMVAIWI